MPKEIELVLKPNNSSANLHKSLKKILYSQVK